MPLLTAVVLVLLSVLLSSCAYYNTFYFARRYYNQAMRVARQPNRSSTAQSSRDTGVPPAVSALLDKSIEKCAKVISFFPKSKWVDDALYLMGECYYQKQEYDRALKKFEELGVYYPKSKLIPSSVFKVGMCHFGNRSYDQAAQVLGKAIQEYPRLEQKHKDTARFTIGEAYLEKKDYQGALANYRKLTARGKSDIYFRSLLRMGQCYFELAAYDSAVASMRVVARSSPDDLQALEALTGIGDAEAAQKEYEDAIDSYEEALEVAEGFGKVPSVKLKIADVVSAMGDYEEAIEQYRYVVDKYPRTPFAGEAQFRIGYLHEVHLEELESAGQAYDRVKDHAPRSEFASQAELRSRGLARLKESGRSSRVSEADRPAESAFLLAELSLFQLGKPDKAIETYLSVERDYPKSVFAPKSAYAVAYIFLHVKHDTTAAVETLMRMIERFPRTEYASAAAEVLGALGVVLPQRYQELIVWEEPPAEVKQPAAEAPRTGAPPGQEPDSLTLQPVARLAAQAPDSVRLPAERPEVVQEPDSLGPREDKAEIGREPDTKSLERARSLLREADREISDLESRARAARERLRADYQNELDPTTLIRGSAIRSAYEQVVSAEEEGVSGLVGESTRASVAERVGQARERLLGRVEQVVRSTLSGSPVALQSLVREIVYDEHVVNSIRARKRVLSDLIETYSRSLGRRPQDEVELRRLEQEPDSLGLREDELGPAQEPDSL